MTEFRLPEPESDNGWVPEVGPDGVMRCSCGRRLVMVDEDTYECAYGYPRFRFSNGEIRKDKWGNLMFSDKPHGRPKDGS